MPRARGFTLVELLLVVAIIGTLIALTIPAVQQIRESARRATCRNNLHELAVGAQNHHTALGHLPTGGWGYMWAGDPNLGYREGQPGGWMFNLLEFIGLRELREKGKGATEAVRRAQGAEAAATLVPVFNCPSRRPARLQVFNGWYYNIDKPKDIARGDFAANSGTVDNGWTTGPASLTAASGYNWEFTQQTGVIYQRSQVTLDSITDGWDRTILFGERSVNPDLYEAGFALNDDQGWNEGYDVDNVAWGNASLRPVQDRPGSQTVFHFGSAHWQSLHFAMCDASVRAVSYKIDTGVWTNLIHRADGQVINDQDY